MEKYTELRQGRVSLADAIPLPKPFTLLVEPTSICNFSCVQCFHSRKEFHGFLPRGFLDYEDFRKILADLKSWKGAKLKVIRFIGFGEPMLHRRLGDMLIDARAADVADRLEITSNCSALTPELSRKLVEAQLDYLRVSIYAAEQERHRKITQSDISISRIHENVRQLREIRGENDRPFIYIKMLDSFDDEENQRFYKMYEDIADEIALEQPHSWLNAKDKSAEERIVCAQPFKMMSLHFNGDVIMCDPDWQGNTCMGNAFSEGLENIWKGHRLLDFQKLQLEGRRKENKSCKNCSFLNGHYVMDDIDSLLGKMNVLCGA